MRICPLALMSGHTYYCNSSCALSSNGECLLAAALKKYANVKYGAVVTYPNSNTGKDSHSGYWDNPIYGWEKDDPVLSSNREYRKNLKEEGF